MVKFECNGCGKCCASFGEFIKVERQITDHDYFCRYGITNELFQAHMLPEFADDFADKFEEMQNNRTDAPNQGCVFTRKNPNGPGVICSIYPNRPTICREFLCYRMLIKHRQTGELRGRLIGINESGPTMRYSQRYGRRRLLTCLTRLNRSITRYRIPTLPAKRNLTAMTLTFLHIFTDWNIPMIGNGSKMS